MKHLLNWSVPFAGIAALFTSSPFGCTSGQEAPAIDGAVAGADAAAGPGADAGFGEDTIAGASSGGGGLDGGVGGSSGGGATAGQGTDAGSSGGAGSGGFSGAGGARGFGGAEVPSGCPNAYLGPSVAEAPPSPFWQNTAIDTGLSAVFQVGITRIIQVTIRNHGTADAPATLLELFWTDAAIAYRAVAGRLIGSHIFNGGIPGRISLPPADGESVVNFGWTPTEIASASGGNVHLLARMENIMAPVQINCPQQFFDVADTTRDPRSAIRSVRVVMP